MYDYSDFPTEVAGYEPQPFIEIVLLVAVVVLPIVAFLLAWSLRGRQEEGDRQKAVQSIYDSINHSARSAAAAVGPAAVYSAELLAKKVRELLGPVLDLNRDLGKHFKALEDALKNEPDKAAGPKPGAAGCTCVCACGCAPAAAPEVKAKDDSQAQGQGQGQSQVSILTSGSVILAAPTPAPTTTTPATAQEKPVLDHQQRVRLAAGEFAHYWGHEAQRVTELKRAQTALLTRAPKVEIGAAASPVRK